MKECPEQADQHEHEQHGEGEETVARHAPLVTQRPQALDAPGGEEVDHARVGRDRRFAEPAAEPLPQGFVFRFARAQRLLGERMAGARRQRLVAGLEFVDGGGRFGRLGTGLVELLDLRLQVCQAGLERPGPALEWILASEQAHGGSTARLEDQQKNDDGDADHDQRPGEGEAHPAELPEAVLLETGPLLSLRLPGTGGREASFAVEHRPLEPGGVPFQPGILDGGQRPGQLDAPVFLLPFLLRDAVDFIERTPQVADGHGELLGGSAAGQLGLLEQADAASKVLHHFLAAGGQLDAPLACLLQLVALALDLLLFAL